MLPDSSASEQDKLTRGDIITSVDHTKIPENMAPADARKLIIGRPGSTVRLGMLDLTKLKTQQSYEVVLERRNMPADATATGPKIFFYGGTDVERDNCVAYLENINAYIVTPVPSKTITVVDTYRQRGAGQHVVVISYDEDPDQKIKNADKICKEAYNLARTLMQGFFPHEKKGVVHFQKPRHIFIVSKYKPLNSLEWDGWVFFHHSDALC